jgi:GT2 family glycosyltransferase
LCDADDVVDHEWAARLLEGLGTADLVAGGTVPWRAGADAAPPDAVPAPTGPGFGGLGFRPVVIGSSVGVRRAAWRAVSGFDEDLAYCEDFDFAFRVQLAGYRVASRPDAYVHYRMPTTIRAAMRKYFAYGHVAPLLYRKFRDDGMPRRSWVDLAKMWLRLAQRSPELFGTRDEQLRWCERFAHACGRVAGSIALRTWFP